MSGDVDMQHNGGIRPKEIAQNKILICCPNHAATSGLTVESGIVCTAATFRVTSR